MQIKDAPSVSVQSSSTGVTISEKHPVKTPQKVEISKEVISESVAIDGIPSKNYYGADLYGRPLNVLELKKLSGITPSNANNTINDILRLAISGVEHDKILTNDKIYLTLWLRANTYPQSGYSVPFECPLCQSESNYDFKTDDIVVNEISDKDVGDIQEIEGDIYRFKYMTIGDETRISKFKDSVKKSMARYDSEIINIAAQIEEINGQKATIMLAYDKLISSPQIFSRVISYLNGFDFGVKETFNVTCNKCGEITTAGLSFRPDFFIPVYRHADAT